MLKENGKEDYYKKLLRNAETYDKSGFYEAFFKNLVDIPKFCHEFLGNKNTKTEKVKTSVDEEKTKTKMVKTEVDEEKTKTEMVKTEVDGEKEKEKNIEKKELSNRMYHLFLISIISCNPSLVEKIYNFEHVSKFIN